MSAKITLIKAREIANTTQDAQIRYAIESLAQQVEQLTVERDASKEYEGKYLDEWLRARNYCDYGASRSITYSDARR